MRQGNQKELLKGFFDVLEDFLIESHQKLGTFLLNQPCLEMNEIDNVINKSCSPNSRKKISGR